MVLNVMNSYYENTYYETSHVMQKIFISNDKISKLGRTL